MAMLLLTAVDHSSYRTTSLINPVLCFFNPSSYSLTYATLHSIEKVDRSRKHRSHSSIYVITDVSRFFYYPLFRPYLVVDIIKADTDSNSY